MTVLTAYLAVSGTGTLTALANPRPQRRQPHCEAGGTISAMTVRSA